MQPTGKGVVRQRRDADEREAEVARTAGASMPRRRSAARRFSAAPDELAARRSTPAPCANHKLVSVDVPDINGRTRSEPAELNFGFVTEARICSRSGIFDAV